MTMNLSVRRALLCKRPGINMICPIITPTLGGNVIVDGDMELAGTANWPALNTPATLAKSGVQAHGGAQSLSVITDAGGGDGCTQNIAAMSTTTWYQFSEWIYRNLGSAIYSSFSSVTLQSSITGAGSWVNRLCTFRFIGADKTLYHYGNPGGVTNWYWDDVVLNPLSNTDALLGTLSQQSGTYTCKPIVADMTQCGIKLCYSNASNFVLAIVDRHNATGNDQAQLWKCVAGVWTSVIAGNIVYGAGNELKIIVSGTNYSLYYNGVQVGVTTAIADALGRSVYGFNTYAGNTVGLVTAG